MNAIAFEYDNIVKIAQNIAQYSESDEHCLEKA